jgi:FkbM family methyltransferase
MHGGYAFKLRKLAAICRCAAYRRALCMGVAAAAEHESLLGRLAFRTVVDVGANHGQFALVSRRCFPGARIVSFEPLPGPAARFRRVFAGDPSVTLQQVAIAPDPGEATMHISGRDDASSLLPITATQEVLFPGTAEVGTATVQVGPLHEFMTVEEIEPPALLKLDVQGFELEALRGCEKLLREFSFVYTECSFVELYAGQALADEVIAWLRERGFCMAGIDNLTYDRAGRAIQADCLFKQGAPPVAG